MKILEWLDQDQSRGGIPAPLAVEIDDNGNAWLIITTLGPNHHTRRFRVMVEETV